MAVVSLGRQRVTVYDKDGWTMRAPVSSGRTGYETPAGIYSILQRKVEHYSNLYDDASMPFMQRLTWSGIALHAGALPGYPASHGCVRMPHGFAERLFDVTRIGMRVIVMRDDIAPADISHSFLFRPASEEDSPLDGAGPRTVALEQAQQPSMVIHKGLRRIAVAKAAEAEDATRRLERARVAAAAKYKEAAQANRMLRTARNAQARAEAQVQQIERQLAATTSTEASERLERARTEASAHLAHLQAQLEGVQAQVQPILDEVEQLREAAIAAQRAKAAADEDAREARRKLAPVSIFISRATRRLYVRQAFQPLFESDVTIADPDVPLGTYVFTALAYENDEADLRWNAISMYGGVPPPQAKTKHRDVPRGGSDVFLTDIGRAGAALDRIAIPEEVRARIEAVISPGSALIVSDEELSRETGQATEFIVVMSGEPQGGIKVRRRDMDAHSRFDRLLRRGHYGYGWGRSFW
jgi:hypothetical protein